MSLELDDSDGVVVLGDTDTFHRSHPSALFHLACDPDERGSVALYGSVRDEKDACQHIACFGGKDE